MKRIKTIDYQDLPYYIIIKTISYYVYVVKKEHTHYKVFGKFSLDMSQKIFLIFKSIYIKGIQLLGPINNYNLPLKITSLNLWECDKFIGDNLPLKIKSLNVGFCNQFIGDNLPKSISSLKVWGCHQFVGDNLPKSITSLKVWRCYQFKGDNYQSQ